MEKRLETVVNVIMFLSLLATAWDLSLVHTFPPIWKKMTHQIIKSLVMAWF